MLIAFITLGIVASLVSFITKNSIQSISGFLGFIFLGKIMILVKWLPKSVLAILSRANYIDLLSNFNKSILMYTGDILDITNLYLVLLTATFTIGI